MIICLTLKNEASESICEHVLEVLSAWITAVFSCWSKYIELQRIVRLLAVERPSSALT
jgi:hypothetical protein